MCDEVGSLMMSRVRGKVEPQEEIEPDVCLAATRWQTTPTLPIHDSKLSDHQTLWLGV